MDLALNNLERLICHKTQPTNQPYLLTFFLGKLFLVSILHNRVFMIYTVNTILISVSFFTNWYKLIVAFWLVNACNIK